MNYVAAFQLEDSEESDNSVASDEEESDVDVASLIPTELVSKMKKHFTTKSDEGEESDEEESTGEHNENSGMKIIETLLNGKEKVR